MNQITGKIIAILDPVSGESKKNPGRMWMRQDFVLETFDTYPRKVNFNLWGEDRIKASDIQMDDIVTVDFDIESREYNGRWYTSINGLNVSKGTMPQTPQAGYAAQPQQPTPAQPAGQSTPPNTNVNFGGDKTDDLPF